MAGGGDRPKGGDGEKTKAKVGREGHTSSRPANMNTESGPNSGLTTKVLVILALFRLLVIVPGLVDLAGSPIDADRGLMLQLGVVPHDLHVDLDDSTRVPRRSIQIEQPDSQVDVRIHDRTVADRVLRDLHVAEDEVALEQPVADVDQLGLWHHNRYDAVDDGVLATACVGRTLELEITSQVVFTRR